MPLSTYVMLTTLDCWPHQLLNYRDYMLAKEKPRMAVHKFQ